MLIFFTAPQQTAALYPHQIQRKEPLLYISLAKQTIRRILEINSSACLIRDSLSKRHLPMGRLPLFPACSISYLSPSTPKASPNRLCRKHHLYIYAAFFNILLTYGMETSFFRFFSNSDSKDRVWGTATISLLTTTAIIFALLFTQAYTIAEAVGMRSHHLFFVGGLTLWHPCHDSVCIPTCHRESQSIYFLKTSQCGSLCGAEPSVFMVDSKKEMTAF